jgi:tetratricopeptide (TPR) repeat protein
MSDVRPHRLGLLLLFVLTFAVYTWVLGYLVFLQYETSSSFFVFSRPFLAPWLDYPGGLLLYVGRFFRQLFRYQWLGALAIAALISTCGLLLHAIRRRLGQPIGIFHTLAPCVCLLALYGAGTLTIGLLVSSAAFLGWLSLPKGRPRQAGALLALPVVYFVAGGYSWLFVAWVFLVEWLDRPWSAGLAAKLAFAALAVCLPYVAYRWVFAISLRTAWLGAFDLPDAWLDRLSVAYLLSVPLWPSIHWGGRWEALCSSRRGLAGQAALAIGLAAWLVAHAYDPDTRRFAEYQRLYHERQWDALLAEATSRPLPGTLGQFFANVALYHQGKLLDEMFRFPQEWGPRGLVLDLPDYAEYGRKAMYNSDLYFEMGHVNAAYKLAYNQVYIVGETYANTMRLAECALVNGNRKVAAKYLDLLDRTLFHREVARQYRALLESPQAADLSELRGRRPTVEIEIGLSDFACLLALAKSHPSNRMAFDYLTAWCLLDKASLPLVAGSIHRFREAGYPYLPVHCQEALMVWERKAGQRADTDGFPYGPDTAARFQRFEQQAQQYPAKSGAEVGLRPAFGNTFMYYYLFTQTPPDDAASSAWLGLGNEITGQGGAGEAIPYYRQAVLRNPESAEAHLQLGLALASVGMAEEAAAHFRQALGPKPGAGVGDGRPEVPRELPSH